MSRLKKEGKDVKETTSKKPLPYTLIKAMVVSQSAYSSHYIELEHNVELHRQHYCSLGPSQRITHKPSTSNQNI